MFAEQLTITVVQLTLYWVILQTAQRTKDDCKIQISGYDWRIQELETSESLGKNREVGLKAKVEDLQSAIEVGASAQDELEQENIRTKVGCSMAMLNTMLLDRHAHSECVTITYSGHHYVM